MANMFKQQSDSSLEAYKKFFLVLFDSIYINSIKVRGRQVTVQGKVFPTNRIMKNPFLTLKNKFPDLELYKVVGSIDMSFSKIDTLEGFPRIIEGSLNCFNVGLRSLIGGPEKVTGYFNVEYNKIESLGGAPAYVGKEFNIARNLIKSLHGISEYIGGDLICSDNPGWTFNRPIGLQGNLIQ